MPDINRRELAMLATGAPLASVMVSTDSHGGISHDNAAIHQEVMFHASPTRLYRILTTNEFDKVVQLSAAMSGAMKTKHGAAPTMIDSQPGGAFSFFGGYITGRNIELVADTRLVQVWRSASWDAGIFSIVRFALDGQGKDTRLIFDHTGFPNDAAATLAKGWSDNYWLPMAKVLAQ